MIPVDVRGTSKSLRGYGKYRRTRDGESFSGNLVLVILFERCLWNIGVYPYEGCECAS